MLPHQVGPRDSHSQQTPQSDLGNFGRESYTLGLKASGQDRLCIDSAEAAIVLGDGISVPWGWWCLGRGGSWCPAHTLPSSSDTITATRPWPSVSHDLPEFGQRCPESADTATREGRLRSACGPEPPCSPWKTPSLLPPLEPPSGHQPCSHIAARAPGPGGLLPCLSQRRKLQLETLRGC